VVGGDAGRGAGRYCGGCCWFLGRKSRLVIGDGRAGSRGVQRSCDGRRGVKIRTIHILEVVVPSFESSRADIFRPNLSNLRGMSRFHTVPSRCYRCPRGSSCRCPTIVVNLSRSCGDTRGGCSIVVVVQRRVRTDTGIGIRCERSFWSTVEAG
jgi:hypothetical protein